MTSLFVIRRARRWVYGRDRSQTRTEPRPFGAGGSSAATRSILLPWRCRWCAACGWWRASHGWPRSPSGVGGAGHYVNGAHRVDGAGDRRGGGSGRRAGRTRATITSFGDAVWWALTTVTTVGYGDRYPVTNEGRIVGGVLMVVGIAAMCRGL
jgi:Ion channel